MQINTIADIANELSRTATWSDFTPEAYANRTNIPGNMPFGYVVHLVNIGRVDLNGLIKLGFFDDYDGVSYIFTKSNQFPNTLQLNAEYRDDNQRVYDFVENISFEDFKALPSFSNLM